MAIAKSPTSEYDKQTHFHSLKTLNAVMHPVQFNYYQLYHNSKNNQIYCSQQIKKHRHQNQRDILTEIRRILHNNHDAIFCFPQHTIARPAAYIQLILHPLLCFKIKRLIMFLLSACSYYHTYYNPRDPTQQPHMCHYQTSPYRRQ